MRTPQAPQSELHVLGVTRVWLQPDLDSKAESLHPPLLPQAQALEDTAQVQLCVVCKVPCQAFCSHCLTSLGLNFLPCKMGRKSAYLLGPS